MQTAVVLFGVALRLSAPFGEYGIEVPEFADRAFPVSEFGAKADGTKCTAAFAAAMAACERGTSEVSKGRWDGPLGAPRLGSQLHSQPRVGLQRMEFSRHLFQRIPHTQGLRRCGAEQLRTGTGGGQHG